MAITTNTRAGSLARVVDANRGHYNAKFSAALRRMPKLDQTPFTDHLRLAVEPIVAAVERENPHATQAVVEALYDQSLVLCGKELIGANARIPLINTVRAPDVRTVSSDAFCRIPGKSFGG
jgi:hypothetical protein